MTDFINAYAKINLTLDFAGKRNDGYHLLRMVMQSVSLCDHIRFEWDKPGIRVLCGRQDIPCDESNTAYRAAGAFFAHSGISPGVSIEIRKNIPSQAGMGGGSADAAAVLHALNRHFGTGYSVKTLCAIGQTVGADVPFCVLGGTALAEGIGEKLTPLLPIPHCFILICKPSVGVNTAKAFALADSSGVSGTATKGMLHAVASGSLSEIALSLGNDFECVVSIPAVASIEDEMRKAGALGACMTGSGSAVFGIFETEGAAASCAELLRRNYKEVFVCKPVGSYTI